VVEKSHEKIVVLLDEEHPGEKPGLRGEMRLKAIGCGRRILVLVESWTVPIIETHLKRLFAFLLCNFFNPIITFT